MRRALAMLMTLYATVSQAAGDDRVAYRLFADGRFAEAAELFTDPAWKGVALYKSDQHWRAAEAFVRAGDPRSLYNLGNCYVQLGYLELALDAYLGAAALDPGNTDAAANADLMRRAIAARDKDKGQGGLRPDARVIDEIAQKDDSGRAEESGDGEDNEPQPQESGDQGVAEQRQAEDRQGGSRQGDGAGGESEQTGDSQDAAGGADVAGTEQQRDAPPGEQPTGGGTAGNESGQAQAAGLRADLEAEQATEQWLNRITDDPGAFLKARIALEQRRRAKAGTAATGEPGAW